jgi:hypothetical protein
MKVEIPNADINKGTKSMGINKSRQKDKGKAHRERKE